MKKNRKWFILSALTLLLMALSYVWYKIRDDKPISSQSPVTVSEEKVPGKELAALITVVKNKEEKLKAIESENPILYKKFIAMLQQLTDAYAELQKELETNINREQVLDAMIQNLELQQDLLNRQLTIYQNIKTDRNA